MKVEAAPAAYAVSYNTNTNLTQEHTLQLELGSITVMNL
jgi:hypothetical protein